MLGVNSSPVCMNALVDELEILKFGEEAKPVLDKFTLPLNSCNPCVSVNIVFVVVFTIFVL